METNRRRGGRPAQGEPLIRRAFRLLTAFDTDTPAQSVSELSERSGIPMSSAFRLASQLVDEGILERLPDGKYAVGLRLLTIAAAAPRGHGLRALALPYMGDLHRATGQHVQFTVRENHDGVLVEKLSTVNASRVLFEAGARYPLHSTGSGLAILAHAEPEFIDEYLAAPLRHRVGDTPIIVDELRGELEAIQAAGIARYTRAHPEPVDLIAAPVFSEHRCVASLSVLSSVGTVDMGRVEPAVIAIARVISREIGRSQFPG